MAGPSSTSFFPPQEDLFARRSSRPRANPPRQGLFGRYIENCWVSCKQKPDQRFNGRMRIFYNPFSLTAYFRLRVKLLLPNVDDTSIKEGANHTGHQVDGLEEQSTQGSPEPTTLYLSIPPEGISRLALERNTLTFQFRNSQAVQLIVPLSVARFGPSTATDALAALGFLAVHTEMVIVMPESALELVQSPLTDLSHEINRCQEGEQHAVKYAYSPEVHISTLYQGQGGRVVDVKRELLLLAQQASPGDLAPPAYGNVRDAYDPHLPTSVQPKSPLKRRRRASSSSESYTSNHNIHKQFDPTGNEHPNSAARVLQELDKKLLDANKLLSEIHKEKAELQKEKAEIKELLEQKAKQGSRWVNLMDTESNRLMKLINAAKQISSCASCSAAAAVSADVCNLPAQVEGEQEKGVVSTSAANSPGPSSSQCTAFTDSQASEMTTERAAAEASSPPLPPLHIRHYIETQLALVRAHIPTDCASITDIKDKCEEVETRLDDDMRSMVTDCVNEEAVRLRDSFMDALQGWPV